MHNGNDYMKYGSHYNNDYMKYGDQKYESGYDGFAGYYEPKLDYCMACKKPYPYHMKKCTYCGNMKCPYCHYCGCKYGCRS